MASATGPALIAAAALVACAAWPGPAEAGRICTAPGVIETVVQELRRQGVPGTVDGRNPGEVTRAGDPVTTCAVWLLQPEVDTNDLPAARPRYRVSVQEFRVRRRANSLVVDLILPAARPAGPGGPFPGPGSIP